MFKLKLFLVKVTNNFTHRCLSLLSIPLTQNLGWIGKWLSLLIKQRTVFLEVFKKKMPNFSEVISLNLYTFRKELCHCLPPKIPFRPCGMSRRSVNFTVKYKQQFYPFVWPGNL